MLSSSFTISGLHYIAVGAFQSHPLIAMIPFTCIVRIILSISSGILSHSSNRLLYAHTIMSNTFAQNGVLHTVLCVPF